MKESKMLSPHREQDWWVYVRVRKIYEENGKWGNHIESASGWEMRYPEWHPGSRIISSRRTEEAVEIADLIAKCQAEGLTVIAPDGPRSVWIVAAPGCWHLDENTETASLRLENDDSNAVGKTLRAAYHLYHEEMGS